MSAFPRGALLLCPNLHAKYYRGDQTCLVGSANLTGAALGWSARPNLELLINLPATSVVLQKFELDLLRNSSVVDESVVEFIRTAVSRLGERLWVIDEGEIADWTDSGDASETAAIEASRWLPTTRDPDDLYLEYVAEIDNLSSETRREARKDLQFFQLPPGLNREEFDAFIGSAMLQAPLIRDIDAFVQTPQRFGAVRDRIRLVVGPQSDASRAWQTSMRWLLYFLPSRYERTVPRHSEVFARTQING